MGIEGIALMDVLLFVGLGSLLLGISSFVFALRSKDRRITSVVVLLLAIVILLFASIHMDYHVGKATLEHQGRTEETLRDYERLDALLDSILERRESE